MPTLTMYGASDDLIEAEGIPGCDEFTADYSNNSLIMGSFHRHFVFHHDNYRGGPPSEITN